jgi:hypothetical protein
MSVPIPVVQSDALSQNSLIHPDRYPDDQEEVR